MWASGCRQGQAGVGSVIMARGPKANGPPVAGAGCSIWHSCQLTWHTQRVEVLLQVLAGETRGSALLPQSQATAMGQHSACAAELGAPPNDLCRGACLTRGAHLLPQHNIRERGPL